MLEALPFELFRAELLFDFEAEAPFLVAFLAVFEAAFFVFVALPLAFDFVDFALLAAFDVFDFAPALALLFLLLALPVAFLSAI
ncbi:MAG TPA: hypothetical protein VNC15_02610 [Solirubrobacterales bacterium]|nr:hypothetical protein [Solirubrobacterales bacterium]